MQRDFLQVIYM